MIRRILSNSKVFTPIQGIIETNVCKVLILYREILTSGIIIAFDKTHTKIEEVLLSCEQQLKPYYLSERRSEGPVNTRFQLTEKGKEFVNLLRKYGTS